MGTGPGSDPGPDPDSYIYYSSKTVSNEAQIQNRLHFCEAVLTWEHEMP